MTAGKLTPQIFDYTSLRRVSCGTSVDEALPAALAAGGYRKGMLVASASLAACTEDFKILRAACDSCQLTLFTGIGAHSPRPHVMAGLARAREAEVEVLVAIGGGSIIDATKVMQLALDQKLQSEAQLTEYAQSADGSRGAKAGDASLFRRPPAVRQIAVPTTLSGAEFSNNAGILDVTRAAKEGYRAPDLCPEQIIYDPALTLHTPAWLWLSTAIRSLDHAIEGYCSADTTEFLDGHFLHAMRLLAATLPATFANSRDLQARHQTQQAIWLACCGLGTVAHGASHGIGYILGSLCDVPHGHTSCVMLPAVLAFNEETQPDRHREIAAALGAPGESAAGAVKALVQSLGLPSTLAEVGVLEAQYAEIAERAAQHPVVRRNPRSIRGPEQVLEILRLASQ